MKRKDIVDTIGKDWLVSNVENDEFSYRKAYNEKGLVFTPIDYGKKSKAEFIDLRFHKNGVSVLVETKTDFAKEPTSEAQLSAYVQYEKELHPENKIVAILANTDNDELKTWIHYVSNETIDYKHTSIINIDEYYGFVYRYLSVAVLCLRRIVHKRFSVFALRYCLVNIDEIEIRVQVINRESIYLSHSHSREH